jgi:hypothetical protein
MEVWIADCIESGDAIPEPAEEIELPSGKWLQRVPRSLHLKLIRLAKEEGVSLNQMVTSALAEAVGSKGITAKKMRSSHVDPPGFYSDILAASCSFVVGKYDVKNEIGIPDYASITSQEYLQHLQPWGRLKDSPNQERRVHAEKKKSSLTYQC